MNCLAISLSENGRIRIYSKLNFTNYQNNSTWITMIHVERSYKINIPEFLSEVDFCCDLEVSFLFISCHNFTHFLNILFFFQKSIEEFEINDMELNSTSSNPIQRQNCNISENEFIEKFVRTHTPVILQNCEGYEWIQKYDFTIEKLAKVE